MNDTSKLEYLIKGIVLLILDIEQNRFAIVL